MKTRKSLRPNVAAPVARTTASTSSSKGGAVEALFMLPPFYPPYVAQKMGLLPFAGDDAE